jgi:hypothetical protein
MTTVQWCWGIRRTDVAAKQQLRRSDGRRAAGS